MLSCKCVTFDQFKLSVLESLAEQRGKIAIDLDRDNLRAASQQFFSERARPWSDFDQQIIRRDLPGIGDDPHQILIDHEILPEPMPRLGPRCRQDCLNLVLGLWHEQDRRFRRLRG